MRSPKEPALRFDLSKKAVSRQSNLMRAEAPARRELHPDEEVLIYRCLKTACHEICHVIGMTHCPYFECLMNGSNLVTEADKKPFALCPVCLRKLDSYCEIGPDGI